MAVWTKLSEKKLGLVVCAFKKGDIQHAIDLRICDRMVIEQQCEGWYKGYVENNKDVSGIFPTTYVHIIQTTCQPSDRKKGEHGSELCDEDRQVVQEVTDTLKEWNKALKRHLILPGIDTIMVQVGIQQETDKLLQLRAAFTFPFLSYNQRTQLRIDIINKIDWGNKKLGLDLVPRSQGQLVGPHDMSPIELYRIHQDTVRLVPGTSTMTPRKSVAKSFNSHHLHLQVKGLTLSEPAQGDLAVYFSIYNYNKGVDSEFLSERVMCRTCSDGTLLDVDVNTLFTSMFVDLTTADLNLPDAYLTAHVYRVGALSKSKDVIKGGKKNVVSYKRPHGCAALALKDILQSQQYARNDDMDISTDFSMPLLLTRNKDDDFCTITDHLIRKMKERKTEERDAGRCTDTVNVTVGMLHGDIIAVRQEASHLFTKNMIFTQKLGFADVIAPEYSAHCVLFKNEVRNDFYLNMFEAEFEKGSKRADKNVEAKAFVVDSQGRELACIAGSSGEELSSQYVAAVFYHCNKPRWNEVIKIALAERTFHDCHIRIEFRHCSNNAAEKKLLAFSYLPLEDSSGTTVPDRLHKLYVYKPSKSESKNHSNITNTPADARPHYLDLAPEYNATGASQRTSNQYCSLTKETVSVKTILCSTKLTQDVNLVNFFKWKDDVASLSKILENVQEVKGDELMRHHTDFLNSLFQMTCDVEAGKQQKLIFEALVHMLKFTKQKNYQGFLPVIEAYIETAFCAPLVHRELLNQMQIVLESCETNNENLLSDVISVLDLLFKFIVRSADLLAQKSTDDAHERLSRGLDGFWQAVQNGLSNSTSQNNTKMTIISRVVDVFPDLLKLLPAENVASSFSNILRNIPKRNSNMGVQKLKCLSKLISSPLFDHQGARQIIVDVCNSQLMFCLENQQDLKVVARNLSDLLISIYNHQDTMKAEAELVILKLMKPLMTSILRYPDDTMILKGELVACFITMLSMTNDELLNKLLDQENAANHARKFCHDMIAILTEVVSESLISDDWMVLRMRFNSVVLSTMKMFSQALVDYFMRDNRFSALAWQNFFMVCVNFITQPCLQLETFSESRQTKLLAWYEDMRVDMGTLLLNMWQELEFDPDGQAELMLTMVGPFLQVTLLPQSQLRSTLIPVFYDMLMCDFENVHGEIIDRLDELCIKGNGDLTFKDAFSQRLLDAANTDSSGRKDQILKFSDSTCLLIELLLDYRYALKFNTEDSKNTLILCTVNLLEFYASEICRPTLYSYYVYKLAELNLQDGLYTEAAFTLLLNASLLDWTDVCLERDSVCPSQMQWERKEKLYTDIIQFFDKGQSWENAIPLCEELANFYKTKLFDYLKLNTVLKQLATLYSKIVPGEKENPRLPCHYYRVAFYGQTLPYCVRGKSFVCKMSAYSGLNAMQSEVRLSYPQAILRPESIETPNMDQLDPGKQYFQVVKIEPEMEPTDRFSSALCTIDHRISDFHLWNDVTTFQYDKCFHSPALDKQNEFKTLNMQRFVMNSKRSLPGISHWCELESMSTTTLSPIETALHALEKKNSDMERIVGGYKNDKGKDQNNLTMLLNGTVDAKVNGGILKYLDAFATAEYAADHPSDKHHIARMKQLAQDHLLIITDGLTLFKEIALSEMRPLLGQLTEEYDKLRGKVKEVDPSFEVASLRSFPAGSVASVYDQISLNSHRASSGYASSDTEKGHEYTTPNMKKFSASGHPQMDSAGKLQRQDGQLGGRRSRSFFYKDISANTDSLTDDDDGGETFGAETDSDDGEGTLTRSEQITPGPALPPKQRSSSLSVQGSLFDPRKPLPPTPAFNNEMKASVSRNPTFHGQLNVYNSPRPNAPPKTKTSPPKNLTLTSRKPALPSPTTPTLPTTPRLPTTPTAKTPVVPPKTPTAQTAKTPLVPPKTPTTPTTKTPVVPPKTPTEPTTKTPVVPPKTPTEPTTKTPVVPPKTPTAQADKTPVVAPRLPATPTANPSAMVHRPVPRPRPGSASGSTCSEDGIAPPPLPARGATPTAPPPLPAKPRLPHS